MVRCSKRESVWIGHRQRLAAHRLPSGDLLSLLKHGLELYERELERQRFAVIGKPRLVRRNRASTNSQASGPLASPRDERERCPAAVAQQVFERDGKRCSYVSPDGRR